MEIATTIFGLIPIVLSVVEIFKRFIPDKQRTYVNPVAAMITGLVGAYFVGGQQEVLNLLMIGGLAGAGAIGAYKIPKEIAAGMGIK